MALTLEQSIAETLNLQIRISTKNLDQSRKGDTLESKPTDWIDRTLESNLGFETNRLDRSNIEIKIKKKIPEDERLEDEIAAD